MRSLDGTGTATGLRGGRLRTYAQRHADAGVPVDVLKELMDHVAVACLTPANRRKRCGIRSLQDRVQITYATDPSRTPRCSGLVDLPGERLKPFTSTCSASAARPNPDPVASSTCRAVVRSVDRSVSPGVTPEDLIAMRSRTRASPARARPSRPRSSSDS